MSKIILKGYIEVPYSDIELIKKELVKHIHNTKLETGCILFEVTQDLEDDSIFNVYEEFVSKEAFEEHQSRVKKSYWGKITKDYKRTYEIVESL
ncbi:putative quinol monooxygenase [Spirochaeta cellobiosiphila]|uniref:putative quinol monooxygenase n=1 Tax=Spirochaeta cellobiosiphila TaxID=504483 RepID=UPI000426B005|nr:antibiotic biosynthesis monooxygenase [Spirochaeta cellobiosiphila]